MIFVAAGVRRLRDDDEAAETFDSVTKRKNPFRCFVLLVAWLDGRELFGTSLSLLFHH